MRNVDKNGAAAQKVACLYIRRHELQDRHALARLLRNIVDTDFTDLYDSSPRVGKPASVAGFSPSPDRLSSVVGLQHTPITLMYPRQGAGLMSLCGEIFLSALNGELADHWTPLLSIGDQQVCPYDQPCLPSCSEPCSAINWSVGQQDTVNFFRTTADGLTFPLPEEAGSSLIGL